MLRTRITGLGYFLPPRVVTNAELAPRLGTTETWIWQRTGIRERHYADAGMHGSDLALEAARRALLSAGRSSADVELIIYSCLSPDRHFPGNACALQAKLGVRGSAALDVRTQCTGFLYGLSIADAFIRAGQYRTILLTGAELQSSGLDFSPRGRDVTPLFGDGAGAVVLEPCTNGDGVLSTHLHADGTGADHLHMDVFDSGRKPFLTPAMVEEGRCWPQMDGREVFCTAIDVLPALVEETLAANGASVGDVDLFVPHQANRRINDITIAKLGLPADRMFSNIDRYGNTSAASIPIALAEAVDGGRLRRGQNVLLAAFGAGYTWASAMVRW